MCNHEFKEYIGVMDRYEYCTKCDAKRGEDGVIKGGKSVERFSGKDLARIDLAKIDLSVMFQPVRTPLLFVNPPLSYSYDLWANKYRDVLSAVYEGNEESNKLGLYPTEVSVPSAYYKTLCYEIGVLNIKHLFGFSVTDSQDSQADHELIFT
jgi:hypothetical protein